MWQLVTKFVTISMLLVVFSLAIVIIVVSVLVIPVFVLKKSPLSEQQDPIFYSLKILFWFRKQELLSN